MSKKAISHVFRLHSMTCHEKSILFVLAAKHDESKGFTQLTAPQIAKWGCMADATCRRGLITLEEAERIQVIRNNTMRGHKYVLVGLDGKTEKDVLLEQFFDDFWNAYPRNVGKVVAKKAFFALAPTPDMAVTILQDITERIMYDWHEREPKYIPHPSSYLNQRQWEDPLEKPDGPDPTERGFVW